MNGLVKKIVYDNTAYYQGKYHFYLSIYDLTHLIAEIISCGETTEYIRFNPFYISTKTGMIEFDEYMCYIECKNNVSVDMRRDFVLECKSDGEAFSEAQNHYALCDINDIASFHQALNNYVSYLDVFIPKLVDVLRERNDVGIENLAFGYFGFEINCD